MRKCRNIKLSSEESKNQTFDPGFIQGETYIWTRSEYSDASGPGIFPNSRNGGTGWTTVSMPQHGLTLSRDIRILSRTVDIS